jgi:hypothetical protein
MLYSGWWCGIMAGTIPSRVASLVLLVACAAVCQERPRNIASNSLPDAPSTVASAPEETSWTLTTAVDPPRIDAPLESEAGKLLRLDSQAFTVRYNTEPAQENSTDLFGKYLYPTLLKRNLNYHPSTSDSLMGRAMYAASRILVSHDETGRDHVNTSYFIGVLSSAALHMAYRPYWNRSASTPFSDFGSTVGSDAGMNLLHEFRPGLEQLMKSHAPRFVSRIEDRIGQH